MRGQIGDATMKRPKQATLRVEVRRAVARQATAADQLVETVEPAEAGWVGDWHELGMHRTAHRRPPTDLQVAEPRFPDTHAARGKHDKAQRSVLYLQPIHAVAQAATKLAQRHTAVGNSKLIGAERWRVTVQIVVGVNQCPSFLTHCSFPDAAVLSNAIHGKPPSPPRPNVRPCGPVFQPRARRLINCDEFVGWVLESQRRADYHRNEWRVPILEFSGMRYPRAIVRRFDFNGPHSFSHRIVRAGN